MIAAPITFFIATSESDSPNGIQKTSPPEAKLRRALKPWRMGRRLWQKFPPLAQVSNAQSPTVGYGGMNPRVGQVRAKAKKSQRYQARFLLLVGEEGLEPSKS
jgi:hypothetical protein